MRLVADQQRNRSVVREFTRRDSPSGRRRHRPQSRFGQLVIEGDRIIEFTEKPLDSGWINGGLWVLEPEVGDYIDGDDTLFEREPMERLAKDGELMAYQHDGFWQCMDTLREKRLLNELWDGGNGKVPPVEARLDIVAELAASLRGDLFHLEPSRFDLLYHACEHHTDGGTEGDETILTCWDADRLDRIVNDPRQLVDHVDIEKGILQVVPEAGPGAPEFSHIGGGRIHGVLAPVFHHRPGSGFSTRGLFCV